MKLLTKRCNNSLALLLNKYILFSTNTSRKEFNYFILKNFYYNIAKAEEKRIMQNFRRINQSH